MRNKSHLTAISRRTLPLPTRWLTEKEFLVGKILDYGCGKCHSVNNRHFKADGYDPYHHQDPKGIIHRLNTNWYNTIICNYVLCVLERRERPFILEDIQRLLNKDGKAYVSVRNDRPKQGWGRSRKGTYQGRVQTLKLPLLYECAGFRTYLLTKDTKLV